MQLIHQRLRPCWEELMMNKIYWIFVIVMAALAIYSTEEAFSQTIISPDGTVTICTTSKDMIICV